MLIGDDCLSVTPALRLTKVRFKKPTLEKPPSPLHDFHFMLPSNLSLVSIPVHRLAKGFTKGKQIIKKRVRYLKGKSTYNGMHL